MEEGNKILPRVFGGKHGPAGLFGASSCQNWEEQILSPNLSAWSWQPQETATPSLQCAALELQGHPSSSYSEAAQSTSALCHQRYLPDPTLSFLCPTLLPWEAHLPQPR